MAMMAERQLEVIYPRAGLLAILVALLTFAACTDEQRVSREDCQRYFFQTPVADTAPVREMSPAEKEEVKSSRACLMSYTAGFPGKEDGFLSATSAAIKSDLDHLNELFAKHGKTSQRSFPGFPTSLHEVKALDDPSSKDAILDDMVREIQIVRGWDRRQVMLWGSFFYLVKLYKEGNYSGLTGEADRLISTYDIHPAKIESLTQAEANSYYSPEMLGNMIVTLKYAAAAKMPRTDSGQAQTLAVAYLRDRPFLAPLFKYSLVDPTKDILGPVCQNMK